MREKYSNGDYSVLVYTGWCLWEVFCVVGRIRWPACGSKLGIRSDCEIYFVCVGFGSQILPATQNTSGALNTPYEVFLI